MIAQLIKIYIILDEHDAFNRTSAT